MILKRVDYRNFRNITCAQWEPHERVSILHGKNAQGKTNLLEGLYFVSQGRSFRCRKDGDMVMHGADIGQISVLYDGNARTDQTATIRFRGGSRPGRCCEHNGVRLERHSELVGKFRTVLFTPQHLELVDGSPEARRTFLDMAMCQLSRDYLKSLQRFHRILEQRNAYIKQLMKKGAASASFDTTAQILSAALAKEGAQIARQRQTYIEDLTEHVTRVFRDISGGRETPELRYRDEMDEETLYSQMEKRFIDEIYRGSSMFGPHRAELILYLNGKQMKGIASQGQMRTMARAMKLGEGEVSKEITGEYPVYLFDDVFSELDQTRRDYLMSGTIGGQVIITSCDPIPGAQKFFEVNEGTIAQVGE